MDKLDLTLLGGDPTSLDDLEFLQNSFAEAITGLASITQNGTTDPVIISGIVGVISGSNTIYSDGFIIHNKEVFFVEGSTIPSASPVCIDITQTYDSGGDQAFEDLLVKQTWIKRRGKVKAIAGGPGEIDLADFITLKQAYAAAGLVTVDTFAAKLEAERQLFFQLRVPNAGTSVAGSQGVFIFATADLNPNSWYNPTTGKFQPQKAGWYKGDFNVCCRIANTLSNFVIQTSLSKNSINSGPYVHCENQYGGAFKQLNLKGSLAIYFNGSSDYAYPTFGMTSSDTIEVLPGSTLTWQFIKSTP